MSIMKLSAISVLILFFTCLPFKLVQADSLEIICPEDTAMFNVEMADFSYVVKVTLECSRNVHFSSFYVDVKPSDSNSLVVNVDGFISSQYIAQYIGGGRSFIVFLTEDQEGFSINTEGNFDDGQSEKKLSYELKISGVPVDE